MSAGKSSTAGGQSEDGEGAAHRGESVGLSMRVRMLTISTQAPESSHGKSAMLSIHTLLAAHIHMHLSLVGPATVADLARTLISAEPPARAPKQPAAIQP